MRKLLIAFGVLIVLVVVAVVVAPFVIPTDVYTNRIAAFVQSATGRELRILFGLPVNAGGNAVRSAARSAAGMS